MPELKTAARVGILGGGLSGATVAIHLARQATVPLEIVVVEPRAQLGAGLAYSTDEPAHRINVPASKMDILGDAPGHFEAWALAQGEIDKDPGARHRHGEQEDLYPQRAVFGRHVAALVQVETARAGVMLQHVRATASYQIENGDAHLWLGTERAPDFDALVIATTPGARQIPGLLAGVATRPGFIADPFDAQALNRIGQNDRVLIIGTGLSMADAVASLEARGHLGPILAVSRRGLLPGEQAEPWGEPVGEFTEPPVRRASELVHRIRQELTAAQARGIPWQNVIDAVRTQNLVIWSQLSVEERRRLLRHARPYWDSHRFRLAPQVAAILKRRLHDGTLGIKRARLASVSKAGNGFAVAFTEATRGGQVEAAQFDHIILATGAEQDNSLTDHPVIAPLLGMGHVSRDPSGLGLAVDEDGRAIGRTGGRSHALHIAGPLTRGALGELVGAPQIAPQAARIAQNIAAALTLPDFLGAAKAGLNEAQVGLRAKPL